MFKSTSQAAKRARREARASQQEHDRRRREHAQRVREAEREASPELNYLKAVSQLRRGVDAVREVGRVLRDDVESIEFDGVPLVAPEHWSAVRDNVQQLIAFASEI